MSDTALLAVASFSAFGHDYSIGSVIPREHYEKWPEGTLATRLNNKSVEFGPAPAAEATASKKKAAAPAAE